MLAKALIPSAIFFILVFNALPSSLGAGVAVDDFAASVTPLGTAPGLTAPAAAAALLLTILPEVTSLNLPPPAILSSNLIFDLSPPSIPLTLSFKPPTIPLDLSFKPSVMPPILLFKPFSKPPDVVILLIRPLKNFI